MSIKHDDEFLTRYQEALQFAAEAHLGQFRKGATVPYLTHPVGVSEILVQFGYPSEVVIAALLHDTVEDTSTTIEAIQARFGARIARLVGAVTEEKLRGGQPISWEERKGRTIEHLHTADHDVVALKAADTLHNAVSIARDLMMVGEGVWERFRRGRDEQLEYYQAVANVVARRLGDVPLTAELVAAVKRLEV